MTLLEFFDSCSFLPDSMESPIQNVYLLQFRDLFNSEHAINASNVLYVLFCKKKIPRVKGESNIIYIGKTKRSLQLRYGPYWNVNNWSLPNLEFVSYVIEHYGPIRVAYLVLGPKEDLNENEGDLLKDYYKQHMELPPKNAGGYGSWNRAIEEP